MIRGKKGRARFTTADRATVRPEHYWSRGEDELMEGLLRKVQTPAALVRACEEAGATTRQTGSGGTLVRGPNGSATISTHWRGRSRANAIADVRRLGLNFDAVLAPPPRSAGVTATSQESVDDVTTEPDEPELEEEVAMGNPARPSPLTAIPTRKPSATQEDLEAAIDLIGTLTGRIEALVTRVDKVEKRVAGLAQGSTYDPGQEIRERVISWFKQLPPGFLAASGTIVSNLEPDADKPTKEAYRRQLANLVKAGQLQSRGESASTQYSLPIEQGAAHE